MFILEILKNGIPCIFYEMTGLYCPGCGSTRAIKALIHGQPMRSISYNPIILYVLCVLCMLLVMGVHTKIVKSQSVSATPILWAVYIGVGILLINWIIKDVSLLFFGIDLMGIL